MDNVVVSALRAWQNRLRGAARPHPRYQRSVRDDADGIHPTGGSIAAFVEARAGRRGGFGRLPAACARVALLVPAARNRRPVLHQTLRRQVGGNAPENDGIKTAPPARRASEGPSVRYQPDAPARVRRSDTSPTRQRGSAGRTPARRASAGPPVGHQPTRSAGPPVTETASERGRPDRRRTLAGASGWYSDGPPTDPRWRVQPV